MIAQSVFFSCKDEAQLKQKFALSLAKNAQKKVWRTETLNPMHECRPEIYQTIDFLILKLNIVL